MDTTVSSPGFCGGLLRPLPSCRCVLVFCLLWCDAAQGEVGRRVLYQWTQAAVSRSTSPIAPGAGIAWARLAVDQFCFVQGVQGFGQGVIVGVTGRTHRRHCLATGESLPVAHVAVLDASVGVVHEPTSVYIIAATLVDRHVQRVQGHVGMQRGRDFPAQDFTRAHALTKET